MWEKFEMDVRSAGNGAELYGRRFNNILLLDGAYLDAGLNLHAGPDAATIYLRCCDQRGAWNSALMAKRGSHETLHFNLFSVDLKETPGPDIGFEIRTVGQNLKAARYAGIRVNWTIALTMMIAGALAGLAGGIETLGVNYKFAPEFTGSVGFDGITVALLGQTHPIGVTIAAFLLGALDAGGARMQFDSGVPADIIQVIQALVLAFVAAPLLIRTIFRLRKPAGQIESAPTVSWGS